MQPVGFPYGTGGSRSSPAPLWREWPGTVGPESLSQSAQRELNPHICHGKAAGGHYIMGAAHGLPVTGCHPDRAESPHGFRTSSSVAGEGVEPSFPSYQDGVLNHWTTRRSASDSCGIRTQPDWRERPATSPEVQRAKTSHPIWCGDARGLQQTPPSSVARWTSAAERLAAPRRPWYRPRPTPIKTGPVSSRHRACEENSQTDPVSASPVTEPPVSPLQATHRRPQVAGADRTSHQAIVQWNACAWGRHDGRLKDPVQETGVPVVCRDPIRRVW